MLKGAGLAMAILSRAGVWVVGQVALHTRGNLSMAKVRGGGGSHVPVTTRAQPHDPVHVFL